MANLSLRNVGKVYDGKVEVLRNISLDAEDGEFVVLVGPSGCGKSTLLRMIAGLEDVTSGEVGIRGKRVNELSPSERNIAMVFQDYALYPHMSVRENLSFGLRIQGRPAPEIAAAVDRSANMLNISHLLERKPAQLSGGQRQRVAIGRAIVRDAALFLFDEPLSNLDAQLRSQTRIELAALHQKMKWTVVYVTHDQVEAMTLATKIVVLNRGDVQQVGSPLELYHRPANKFVASFIGNPSMNFFDGDLSLEQGKKRFRLADGHVLDFSQAPAPRVAGRYCLGLRPEALKPLARDGREAQGSVDVEPEVLLLEPHGHECHLVANIAGQQVVIRSANPKRLQAMEAAQRGDTLKTTIDREALHWFTPVHGDAGGVRVTDLA